jgi:putative transposase
MRAMNIEAIYPKPKLSQANKAHQKYGYLLRDIAIHAGQVWCTDITYIKLGKGFVYLVALIDVYSRYIVAWRLSVTLDTHFCLEMLNDALTHHKAPEIINTDQGCQFTSIAWIEKVESAGIRVSMDGRGRWADNIPIERFWRTVKYEHVFLYCYESVQDARQRLGEFIDFYNERRLHQSLDYSPPSEVWRGLISVAPFCFKKRREENLKNAA